MFGAGLLSFLGAICLLPGANGSAPQQSLSADTVAIGVLLPANATEAASLRQGAALGIEAVRCSSASAARLVLRGRPGQWGTEGGEAAALALDEQVAGIITPSDGTAAHEILQVSGRTRVPVISLCPDGSVTAAGVPWAVRIVPRTEDEARSIFVGKPGLRWGAVVPAGRAGREAATDLKKAARSAACELLEPIRVPDDNSNQFELLLVRSVLGSAPNGVLVWLDPVGAAACTRALRQAGFQGTLAGPGRLDSDSFLQRAGKAAEGFIVPAIAPPERANRVAAFEQEYRKQFATRPDFTATMAHDAVLVLLEILRQAEPDRAYLRFPVQSSLVGASGPIKFDGSGNRILSLVLKRCEDGDFKL